MNPITRHLFTGLTLTALTLACLEATVRLLNYNPKAEYIFEPPLTQEDKLLGYHLNSGIRVKAAKKRDGKTIFDVLYSTDEYGRRVTPEQDNKKATRFILFFGGSFTFGEGVEDNQTLPFYVSKLAPRYKVYNYGVGGYGPQHMIEQLRSPHLLNDIKERDEGILVYTFIDHHIPRAIGWMQILTWGGHFPYYTVDEENRLIRNGSFISGRPFVSTVYIWLWKSQLVQFLDRVLHWPAISEDDIKLTARIIEESRDTFREQFHSDTFYVLFYPKYGGAYAGRLIRYLEQAKIKYLDYSNLTDSMMTDTIPDGSHPSASSYRAVAAKLAEDIGLLASRPEAKQGTKKNRVRLLRLSDSPRPEHLSRSSPPLPFDRITTN